jgi:hypothetical protein
MSEEEVLEFEITGAGVPEANGKYTLTNPCGRSNRPEYTHTSNPEYKIQWSSMSSVWMLDNVHGPAPYMIPGRDDSKFPWDAEWSVYQGGRLPLPKTIYFKPESEVPLPTFEILFSKKVGVSGLILKRLYVGVDLKPSLNHNLLGCPN